VAVLGVALGEAHIKILKHFVDRVILVLDGDEAGQKRAKEILELFVAQQVDLRILTLPDDLDPCDFLHQRGAEAFAELLATGTLDALDHAYRTETRGLDLDRDVHGATQALERLLAILARAPRLRADTTSEDRLREEKFLQRIAALFRVNETEVRRRLTALRRRMQDTGKTPIQPDAGSPASTTVSAEQAVLKSSGKPHSKTEPAWRPGDAIDTYEREFAELLIVYPDTWAAARAAISPAELISPVLRRIYETGCRLLDVGVLPDFDRLILEFDDPSLKSLLVDLDEQGRAKGSRMAEPAELLSELLKAFQRREVEKQQPGQLVALREQNLDDDQEKDLLQKIVQQARSRQGISDPTEG
jgi:DNA primase